MDGLPGNEWSSYVLSLCIPQLQIRHGLVVDKRENLNSLMIPRFLPGCAILFERGFSVHVS